MHYHQPDGVFGGHLDLELAEGNEATCSHGIVDVRIAPSLALATETYNYKIILPGGRRRGRKRGGATSVRGKIGTSERHANALPHGVHSRSG